MVVPVQPHSRAVATAQAARLAAPREEPAFPPLSLVAATAGADSGVEMAASSAFRPLTSRDLPWIFVWPNHAPSFW